MIHDIRPIRGKACQSSVVDRQWRPWSLTVLFLLLSIGINLSAAIPPAEKVLPDDTLMMVTTPDFGRAMEIYTNSPQTRMWNDAAMRPLKDKFMSKLKEELIEPFERDLGIQLSDYTGLPQGQVTIALTQNGWENGNGQSPAWLLLIDTRNKSDQLKTNLAELRRKWVDAGKTIRTEKIRDIEFSIAPITGKDIPKSVKKLYTPTFPGEDLAEDEEEKKESKGELTIGQFESLLILGNSTKAVEKVAVLLTGGSAPPLDSLASFEASRLSLFRTAPICGWANVKAFTEIMSRKPKDSGENPLSMFSPDKILSALGIDGVKTAAFTVEHSSEGELVQFFISVPESARQGIFKLLPAESKDSSPPPFVPADAVEFQRWRMDGQKAWANVQKMASDVKALGTLNFILENAEASAKQKDPDFDIKKNLFGNLGDDIIIYKKSSRGGALADLTAPPALYLIGSPKPEELAAALKSVFVLLSAQGGNPTEREFLGRKILSVPLPAAGRAPGAPGATRKRLSYAASGGYVALSTDASILEEYLRSSESPQKPLRETEGLVDAAAKAGGMSTGWFAYENQLETTRAAFEALRRNTNSLSTGSTSSLASGLMGVPTGDSVVREWLDLSLLPPFEQVSKYFHFTVSATAINTEGVSYKLFAPVPPQLKK